MTVDTQEAARIAVSHADWLTWAEQAIRGQEDYDALHEHEDPPVSVEQVRAYMLAQVAAGLRAVFPSMASRVLGPAYELLNGWYSYWKHNDALPAKLPDGLHTATAAALIRANWELGLSYSIGDPRIDAPSIVPVDGPPPVMFLCAGDCRQYYTPEAGDFVIALTTGFICSTCRKDRLDG